MQTETPDEGFKRAINLSQMEGKKTRPDDEVRSKLRVAYANNADSLTMASHVGAVNFQTLAATNDYLR
ncbi:MAG: hexameric tyrosine-coordinated heme protein [Rhizobiaceae bacterium]